MLTAGSSRNPQTRETFNERDFLEFWERAEKGELNSSEQLKLEYGSDCLWSASDFEKFRLVLNPRRERTPYVLRISLRGAHFLLLYREGWARECLV